MRFNFSFNNDTVLKAALLKAHIQNVKISTEIRFRIVIIEVLQLTRYLKRIRNIIRMKGIKLRDVEQKRHNSANKGRSTNCQVYRKLVMNNAGSI